MDVAGPSSEPMLSMVEQAEGDARRATQSAETRADTADARVTQLTTQLAQLGGTCIAYTPTARDAAYSPIAYFELLSYCVFPTAYSDRENRS